MGFEIEDYQYLHALIYRLNENKTSTAEDSYKSLTTGSSAFNILLTAKDIHDSLAAGGSDSNTLCRLRVLANKGLVTCKEDINPQTNKKAYLFSLNTKNLRAIWCFLVKERLEQQFKDPLFKTYPLNGLNEHKPELLNFDQLESIFDANKSLLTKKIGPKVIKQNKNRTIIDFFIRKITKRSRFDIFCALFHYFYLSIVSPYVIHNKFGTKDSVNGLFSNSFKECIEFSHKKDFKDYLKTIESDPYLKKALVLNDNLQLVKEYDKKHNELLEDLAKKWRPI